MKISDLYGKGGPIHKQDVYIVGLGSSMRMMPTKVLTNKTCILVNDGAKHFPKLGPIAFSNNRRFYIKARNTNITHWCVKARLKSDPRVMRDDNHVEWRDPRYYCFSYRLKQYDGFDHFDQRRIWVEPCHYWNYPGGNVAIFAVQFAVLAGARTVTLVGCDCCELLGMRYATRKASKNRIRLARSRHVQVSHQLNPADYHGYTTGLQIIQQRALADYGVPVITLTPFVGLANIEKQFAAWHEIQKLDPKEI